MSGRNLTGHEAPEAKVPAEEAAFLGAPTNTGAGDHSTPAMDSESSASAGRISWSPDYGAAERLASQAQSLVGKERLYKQSLEAQFSARIRDLEVALRDRDRLLDDMAHALERMESDGQFGFDVRELMVRVLEDGPSALSLGECCWILDQAARAVAAKAERNRLRERVAELERALEYALRHTPGHNHWRVGGAGGRCDACDRSAAVADHLRAAFEAGSTTPAVSAGNEQ